MAYTLKFWKSGTVTWNYGGNTAPQDHPSGDEAAFTSYIASIATLSSYAAGKLNSYGQDIRIGYRSSDTGTFFAGAFDDYILMDLSAASLIYMFNSEGKLVQVDIRLTIMHELAHIYLPGQDPGAPNETAMNGSSYDFRGAVINEQNAIATDAGLTAQIQTAYDAAFTSSDPRYSLFTTGSSYSEDREVDVTRLGTDSADNIDHTARTETTVPGMLSDLLFGLGGNDTIKGGDGDDFLYGGAGPSSTGSGKDKLYGGAGGDMLFGGDDNDFLDSGLNVIDPLSDTEREDRLDGGAGDDILIMRGIWCLATGGAGDDQFWIADTADGSSYEIMDSDSGDSLYWRGYHLEGGTKQVIELIYDQTGFGTAQIGALDGNGFIYSLYGDVLLINAPDGSAVLVYDFQDGDLGISVGSAITNTEVTFQWVEVQPSSWEFQYETALSLSTIADNGQEYDYSSLPGFSSTLAADGPNALPTSWLP